MGTTFTREELWLLQDLVDHERENRWDGRYPPFSIRLNDSIAYGLLFCYDNDENEATIELSLHDCYVIDYLVDNTIVDADGKSIGKTVLLKSFRARKDIEFGQEVITTEPTYDKDKLLEEFKSAYYDTSTNTNPDYDPYDHTN